MAAKSKSASGRRQQRVQQPERVTQAPDLRARRLPQARSDGIGVHSSYPSSVNKYDTFIRDILDAAKPKADATHQFWKSAREFILDLEEDHTTQVRIFPRFAVVFLAILTYYSRYLMLTGFEGTGMIHPDETFQAIEVAHGEVYGYRFDPYNNLTDGLRPPQPWFYTYIYVLLFHARDFFGWKAAPFTVARSFHSLVAAMLPVVVYKFTRTLFSQCRDIAFVAATLVAFSKHLMLFGIHPFLQSLNSPVIFLTLTVLLRIVVPVHQTRYATALPSTRHPGTLKSRDLSQTELLGLFVCGFVLGLAILLQVDSSLMIVLCVILGLPSTTLPGIVFSLGSGTLLGLAFGATTDFIHSGKWFETPLRTVEFLRTHSTASSIHSSFFGYFHNFLSASHVHVAILCATLTITAIYLTYFYRLSDIFDGWIGGDGPELPLFFSTFKTFIVAVFLLAFYSCQNHQEAHFVHDVLVLLLIAGAAAVYLLYRGLYTYILQIAEPQRVTKNIVKLILYAELLLYMFESRVTFPTAQSGSIAAWTYKGYGDSAFVNRCLGYVGRQSDVTGVLVDYSVQLTGGFSLMHHDIPIYAKNDFEFREWGLERRQNVTAHKSVLQVIRQWRSVHTNPGRISVAALDEVTDCISVLNVPLLTKRLLEDATYNYVVVSNGRKFFRKGFREVFNASDTRVFKRSNSRTEKEYLLDVASKIRMGTNATVLRYEGHCLVVLQLYHKAVERLEQAVRLDASELKTWQLLTFTLQQMKLDDEVSRVLAQCRKVHGPRCNREIEPSEENSQTSLQIDFNSLKEMFKENITYKFSVPNS